MATTSPIIVLNTDFTITATNNAACELLDADRSAVQSSPIDEYFVPVNQSDWYSVTDDLTEGSTRTVDCEQRGGTISLPGQISFLDTSNTKEYHLHLTVNERDLTDARRKESDSACCQLVKQSHEALAIVQDGQFVLVNPAMTELAGRSRDELLDSCFYDIFATDCQERLRESQTLNDLQTDETVVFEVDFESGVNVDRFIELEASKIDYRNRDALLVTLQDVTERKRYEKELEQLNTRLNLALEGTDTGVWSWHPETDELEWDEQSKALFGYETERFPESFPGDSSAFFRRIHPEDRPDVKTEIDRVLNGDQQYHAAFRIQLPDDDIRWIEARGIVDDDPDGRTRLIGVQTDITDLKETRQDLHEAVREAQQSEQLFRDMAGALQDCFWIFNHDFSDVLYVNEAYEDIFGQPVEDFRENSMKFLENALEEDLPDVQEAMRKLQQPGEPTDVEMEWRINKNGEIRWLMSRGFVFSNPDGSTDRIVGYTTDITDRKKKTKRLEEVTTRLQLALEKTETGIWEWDLTTDEVIWDDQTKELFGYDSDEFPGDYEAFRERIHPDDVDTVERKLRRAVENNERYEANFRIIRPNGEQFWIQSRGTVLYEDGEPDRMLGVQTDISDLKTMEQKLQEREKMFREVVNNVQEVVWLTDPENRDHIFVNPRYEEIWGQSVESLYDDPGSLLDPVHPDDRERVKEALDRRFEGEYELKYRVIDPEGKVRWIHDRANPVTDNNGSVERIVGISEDITQYKETQRELRQAKQKLEDANKELEKAAREDALTDLPNRRYFNESLQREWARALRNQEPLSLLMIDIDRFKDYNDSFGHTQGDEVLREISSVLRDKVKRSNDFAARFGGEEFAVILPDTDEDGARTVAKTIRREVENLGIKHSPRVEQKHVTISVGVQCIVPDEEDNTEKLIREADEALYNAKEAGRNTVRVSEKDRCSREATRH